MIAAFIILIRRGHFQPVRRGLNRARTVVAKRARRTFYSGSSEAHSNYAYDVIKYNQSLQKHTPFCFDNHCYVNLDVNYYSNTYSTMSYTLIDRR